jgi:DNA-formamidopyrimidine glycosylase
MPEGPEVKKLVDILKNLINKPIKDIKILGGKYSKKNINDMDKLINLKIKSINCYGKFIYWEFHNSDIVMFNTLGMTGWWVYHSDNNDIHNNVKFVIGNDTLYFNDMRNFGNIIVANKEKLIKKLDSLGADMFNMNDFDKFKKKLLKKRDDIMICTALLDQNIIAGCGNYLRAEALYIAKISPFRTVKNISDDELHTLWEILVMLGWYYYDENKGRKLKIINDKYKLAGKYKKTGPSKYKPAEGLFHVYRQKTDSDGNIVFSTKINDRTIYYVDFIQK